MHALKIVGRYFMYYLKAVNEHSLHSPYIYNLYNNVIKQEDADPYFLDIEVQRKRLEKDHSQVSITDMGAGRQGKKSPLRKVSDIVKTSVAPARKSRLLYRLLQHYEPEQVIELGTSLGINTLYLSHGSHAPVVTFEGCRHTAEKAENLFKTMGKENQIRLIRGNLDQTLGPFLEDMEKVDFAFIDANHSFEPTMRYFNLLAQKSTSSTIIVLDDIHWSTDMEKAWLQIREDPRVFLSVDLFHVGLAIFKPLYIKQHYILEF